jgi:hypothetical protein
MNESTAHTNCITLLVPFAMFCGAGIATGYGLDDCGAGVRVPVGSRISILQIVQTSSGVHPTSYPRGTGGSFTGGKAAGA